MIWRETRPRTGFRPEGPVMRITFLEPDLGGAAVLRTPDGHCVVIDPGPGRKGENLVTFLDDLGIRNVTAVLTCASERNAGAAKALLEALKLDRVVHERSAQKLKSLEEWLSEARRMGVSEMSLSDGDRVGLASNVALEALSPPDTNIEDRRISESMVFRIRYGDVRILFLSEGGPDVEGYLISSGRDLSSDVLVIGGPSDSQAVSLELISLVRPGYFVLRAGGAYGRPSRSLLSRISTEHTGADAFRTDTDGRIELATDGRTIALEKAEGSGNN